MNYNDGILYNKKYLVIVPTKKKTYFNYLRYSFNDVVLFNPKNDIENLKRFINNNNFRQLIFVDYIPEYFEIIGSQREHHVIKFLFTGSLGGFSDMKLYYEFKKILELYNNDNISSVGFLDKNLYESFKEKINCSYVILDVQNSNTSKDSSDNNVVGILSDDSKDTHSFYNSLSAIKLSDCIANIYGYSKETKKFLRLFNINYITSKSTLELIKKSSINLYINFTDNNNLLFIESMDNNVPCILGNNSLLNGKLKDMLTVNSDDSIDEISNKILYVRNHKKNIMREYKKFRKSYSNNSEKSIEEFLGCKKKCEFKSEYPLLLSIVVPVYNTEKYLESCLKSILKALPNKIIDKTEILIINDGSSDNSEEIILKYKNNFPDLIKYIKQDNHGLGNVRNVGLKNAKGKYIASIDSDDTIDSRFFISALDAMNNNIDVVICDWLSVTNDSSFQTPAIECFLNNKVNKYEGMLYTTIMPSSCNKIIKKAIFDELGITYMEDKYEDLSTNPFIMLAAKTIKYINKPYYRYYIRSNSIMRSSAGTSMIKVIKEFDNRLKKYKNYVNVDINKFKFYTYSWRIEEFIINQLYDLKDKELEKFINLIYSQIYTIIKEMFDNEYYIKFINKLNDNTIIDRNKSINKKSLINYVIKHKKDAHKINALIVYSNSL